MKRCRCRDYATDAFQYSAQVGGYEKYEQQLHDRLIKEAAEGRNLNEAGISGDGLGDGVQSAEWRYQRLLAEHTSEMADLLAVQETMELMQRMGWTRDKCRAVELVYFKEPWLEMDGDAIHELVHSAEISIPASESSIYYWLSDARAIFCLKRGLRITTSQERRLRKLMLL